MCIGDYEIIFTESLDSNTWINHALVQCSVKLQISSTSMIHILGLADSCIFEHLFIPLKGLRASEKSLSAKQETAVISGGLCVPQSW